MRKLLTPGSSEHYDLAPASLASAHASSRSGMDGLAYTPTEPLPPPAFSTAPRPFAGGPGGYKRISDMHTSYHQSYASSTARASYRSPSVPPGGSGGLLARSFSGTFTSPLAQQTPHPAFAPPVQQSRDAHVAWREPSARPEPIFSPPTMHPQQRWSPPGPNTVRYHSPPPPPVPAAPKSPPQAQPPPPTTTTPSDPMPPPWSTPPEEFRPPHTGRASSSAPIAQPRPPPDDPIYWPNPNVKDDIADHWASFTKPKAKPQAPELRSSPELQPILASSSHSKAPAQAAGKRDAPHVRFEGKREVFFITPNPSPSPAPPDTQPNWRKAKHSPSPEPQPRPVTVEHEIDTSSLRGAGPIVWPPARPQERTRSEIATALPVQIAVVGEEIEKVIGPQMRAKAKPPIITLRNASNPSRLPAEPPSRQPMSEPERLRLRKVMPPLKAPELLEVPSSPEPESEYHEARAYFEHPDSFQRTLQRLVSCLLHQPCNCELLVSPARHAFHSSSSWQCRIW